MNQAFECPNCGAPLAYPTSSGTAVRCPYCASTILLPVALRQSFPAGLPVPATTSSDLAGLAVTLQEIKQLVSNGEKIEAIKLYKDTFGVGLKAAKEAVERIERGEPVQLTQVSVNYAGRQVLSSREIRTELRQLLDSGDKLEAIKLYRGVFNTGLSESKDAVEIFENGEDLPVPIGWGQDVAILPLDSDQELAEVASLARQGNHLAAVQLYREIFDSSLQEAQAIVERLAQDLEGDPGWIAEQVRAGLRENQARETVEISNKVRKGSCLYAALSIVVIGSILFGLLAGLVQAFAPLRQTWQRLNPASYAKLVDSFGGEGTGPGLFSDPRAVAVGQDGSLYVGDYVDGRIQRFASRGQFLNQWSTQEESYLDSLAIDRTDQVYAAYRGDIWRYAGPTGEALGVLPNPADHYFDYAVLAPDGNLLAVASGENLVRLDNEGQVQWVVEEAISSVSGDAELDTRLAVDGLGYIYALGTFNSAVFKFSPEGRFLNRWGSAGDEPGQFRAPDAIAVDGYGRVLVSDVHGVQVFTGQDGRFLDRFDVPGVVFAMAFNEQNELYAVSNDHKVYHYRLKEPQPMVFNLRIPGSVVRSGLGQFD